MLSDQLKGVEQLRPRPLRRLASQLAGLVENRLWLQVLVGMVLGLGVGVALGPAAGWVEPELGLLIGSWLAVPGQLFLAAFQMIVVPLVFACMIVGLASSVNVELL